MIRKQDALTYHSSGRPGKIEVLPTKPCTTQRDLGLAYSPGVAEPCLEIARDPDLVYRYTARGNLVAVISNGTAVLGLGNIGPLASKPVMEGKGVLFKKFADIDVFDLEVDATDPDHFVSVVRALEPTFGGINLEDIKAPECFAIERKLRETMSIPVFHDDQHGTSIITAAALLNSLELQRKRIDEASVVVSGAGASAIACMKLWIRLGVRPQNIIMCDSKGVIHTGRDDLDSFKREFARDTRTRTLAEAMRGADVFCGLSKGGLVSKEMVASMAERPIVFALANPDPEISYPDAMSARNDVVAATGRSDFPNQVNNVLGFPYIFRGALDVRARTINEEMKIAAVRALAALAREDVPDGVLEAYGAASIRYGSDYIIPKPFDERVLLWVAPAVAEAAMATGVAREHLDLREYRERLERLLGPRRQVMRKMIHIAQQGPTRQRLVLPEGEEDKVLRAAQILLDERIAQPILIGDPARIQERVAQLDLDILGAGGAVVVHPPNSPLLERYIPALWQMRQRKGVTLVEARKLLTRSRNHFGMMMLALGDADGVVSGLTMSYSETIRPALQIVGLERGVRFAAGMYVMILKNDVKFFADTTVNIEPNDEALAEIAIACADAARDLGVEPRVAMLSFSNFGGTQHPHADKVRRATQAVKERRPDIVIDGEMQADVAVNPQLLQELWPFASLKEAANVLIFPDLDSGNVAYKLLTELGGAEAVGPILLGMKKPVNVLQRGCSVDAIVHVAAITVARTLRAQAKQASRPSPEPAAGV